MPMRRKHAGRDRETIAGLVTVLTPIARRLATDKELRHELRSAADSLAGAYRRTRGGHEPRPATGGGRLRAYEETLGGDRSAGATVTTEVVDGGLPRKRVGAGRRLRFGLAAAAAAGAGATVALLAGRRARDR